MAKTIAEINAKISSGQAVVVTAEEVIEIVEKQGRRCTRAHPIRMPTMRGGLE